jgi:hypothetical protein
MPTTRLRLLLGAFGVLATGPLTGCASLQELDQTSYAANFPSGPGRTYYLKKSPFRTTILVCDAGPREAYCFEKPQ